MINSDPKTGQVTFVCTVAPKAKKVFLVGDFNDWDATARKMVKVKDGSFRAKMELAPGRYEYKFVVDGEWIGDPDSDHQVCNPFGSCNSVVIVGSDACGCACGGCGCD